MTKKQSPNGEGTMGWICDYCGLIFEFPVHPDNQECMRKYKDKWGTYD